MGQSQSSTLSCEPTMAMDLREQNSQEGLIVCSQGTNTRSRRTEDDFEMVNMALDDALFDAIRTKKASVEAERKRLQKMTEQQTRLRLKEQSKVTGPMRKTMLGILNDPRFTELSDSSQCRSMP